MTAPVADPGPDMIRIEERGGAAVVVVRGDIDVRTARALRDALARAVSGHQRVVVDLSQAARIDRTGLSVLIAAQDRANSRAVQLCFTAPSPELLAALCAMRAGETLAAVAPAVARPQPQPGGEPGFLLPRPSPTLPFLPRAAL